MHNRLKEIRKSQSPKMSQERFAEELGTTRNAYKSYENGLVVPNNTFIKMLCTRFSINEEWLRTGEGDMKQTGDNPILVQLRKEYSLDALDEIILRSFLELKPEQRAAVTAYITKLADEMRAEQERAAADMAGGTQAAPNTQSSAALVSEDEPQTSADLVSEADRAAAHAALDAELNAHDGKKSSPSTGTSTAAN